MIDAYRESDDKAEMIQLAHDMTQLHHDYASFSPGFYQPFYRVGHWRWIRYPDDFNVKHSRSAAEYWVHWIDSELKTETMEAQKNGTAFEPEINVYDQYR